LIDEGNQNENDKLLEREFGESEEVMLAPCMCKIYKELAYRNLLPQYFIVQAKTNYKG
jgi:hypothetical protein